MNRARSGWCSMMVLLGLALPGGCGGGGDGGGTTAPGPLASVVITSPPSPPTIGALGRTVQFTAVGKDASGVTIPNTTITWSSSDPTVATVGTDGLVTAVANGTTTITASSGGISSAGRAVTVAQVPATIVVSTTGSDTLVTTGRTRQYTAVVKDSTGNVIAGSGVSWSSSAPGVATVGAGTGLATAVSDGTANIIATSGAASGQRALVVRRYAATFALSPNTPQTITVNGGTIVFTGTAQDSSPAALTITWTSRNTAVITMSPTSGASGSSSTATARGNGSTYVVLSAGTRSDSAQVTASNQTGPPPAQTASVTVGDIFFMSARNLTSNPAVDTIAAGGTVTWTWSGALPHSVESTGNPTFTSSTIQTSGTYQITFASAGTYTYDCTVHGTQMTGRIVVR